MQKLMIFVLASFAVQIQAQKLSTRDGYIRFFSEAPLENIEAINEQASSVLDLNTGKFAFLVPIQGFTFEKALMQEHFNENYLESGQFPNATFKGKVTDLKKLDLSEAGGKELTFQGTMNIHGVEQAFEEPVKVTVEKDRVKLQSTFMLKVADYDISIPDGKSDNISKEIEVTVKFDYARS